MQSALRICRAIVAVTLMALSIALFDVGAALAQAPQSKFAEVNGVKLHYLIAGEGDPVVLLHGYAETSHMWLPLISKLADRHTVIAPDLRGFGQSSAPDAGYTKKAMAQDVHALMRSLHYDRIRLVGHDIGLMVAYAYAAQYPDVVDRLVLMEAFLPGVGDWNSVFLLRDLWHFHFYGKTPLALVTGRERIYLEHFWNDFAADPAKSVPEEDREFYTKAYAEPGHMKAGMEVFRAFPKDAEDFAQFAKVRRARRSQLLSHLFQCARNRHRHRPGVRDGCLQLLYRPHHVYRQCREGLAQDRLVRGAVHGILSDAAQ